MIRWLAAANLSATLFMTGLIWFVQIVHYPLFGGVGEERFASYGRRHSVLTGFVVGPPMLVEALTGAALVLVRPKGMPGWAAAAGFGLILAIWLSTALLQIPSHGELSLGFRAETHRALVRTNWIRTFAWSLRSLLMLWVLFRTSE